MKTPFALLTATALCIATHIGNLRAAEPPARNEANVSLRNEVLIAIDKGLAWLQQQQQADGSFATPENPAPPAEHPALTAVGPPLAAGPVGRRAGVAGQNLLNTQVTTDAGAVETIEQVIGASDRRNIPDTVLLPARPRANVRGRKWISFGCR